ncbi:hypothetical protein ACQP3L_36400, partial [Escherichia coli]
MLVEWREANAETHLSLYGNTAFDVVFPPQLQHLRYCLATVRTYECSCILEILFLDFKSLNKDMSLQNG